MESLILIILTIMPGVWSGDWKVTFENQCALKGSSVVMKCKYDYPFGHLVSSVSWYKLLFKSSRGMLYPLNTLSSPPDHFEYVGNYYGNCNLMVNNVQPADEGAYYFGFMTTLNRWRSRTRAYLSVSELTTVVQPNTVKEGDHVRLTCLSGCPEPTDIAWFKDGHPVTSPVFQARREDAGRYYCAVQGQETVRSVPVALDVQYAPKAVTLSMSPSGDIISGGTVTFTCNSDANPSVTHSGYSLYKDGQLISSGQNHTISDILPSHRGFYYCQAWNNISWRGIELINSTEVHLDVQYRPKNISVSMHPSHVAEGSSVNLTCSSAANPAADNYTWYKMNASANSSSMLYVGSGQVLLLPPMKESHTGVYFCQVRNSLGESNSTQVLLAIQRKQNGGQSIPILAGIGVSFFVTLLIALLLLRKKKRPSENKNTAVHPMLSRTGSKSSATEDPSDVVYANIGTCPSSTPSIQPLALATASQRNSDDNDATSFEDEVTYSTVTISPRNPTLPPHINTTTGHQDSRSEAREDDNFVIYATVVKSR